MKNFKMKYLIPILIIAFALFAASIFLVKEFKISKNIAEKFLKTYYTVENSDLYNAMMNDPTKAYEIYAELKTKYSDYATDKAIEKASANRVIFEGEKLAAEEGCTISLLKIKLTKGKTSSNGDFQYSYVTKISINYSDNTKEEITLDGNLLMTKIKSKWKVDSFNPKIGWSANIDSNSILSSPSSVNSNIIEDFTIKTPKIAGDFIAVDGYLIINNASYPDAYLFDGKNFNNLDVKSKNISFETSFEGKKTLEFNYIEDKNHVIVIYYSMEDYYHFINLKDKQYDLLEFDYSIYLIDIKNNSIKPALLETGEYKFSQIKEKLKTIDPEEFSLEWGAGPQPNLSGNKFTYHTNRNVLKGGSSNGETWLKNLDTEEDFYLGEFGNNCLGWDINDNVYYWNYDHDIISVNTNNGEKETILYDAASSSVLMYPSIVFSNDKNDGFAIYNITNKTTEYIYNDKLSAISGLMVNPAKTAVLFHNAVHRSDAEFDVPGSSLGIFNIADKTIRFLNIPDRFTMQGYSWVNDEFISIVLFEFNTKEENTYLVDLSYFTN